VEEDDDDEKTLSYQSVPTSPNPNQYDNISTASSSLSVISNSIVAQLKPLTESFGQQLVPLHTEEGNQAFNSDDEVETADLEHLEPKLRDAWIKMRKLDLRLARCTQKERSVKRETAALIEKNRAELAQLRVESNHKETKWEAENTAHFLALSYVDLDDEVQKVTGLDFGGGTGGHEALATPLFKTEMPYDCDNVSLADEKTDVKSEKKSQHKTSFNNNNSDNAKDSSGNKYGKAKGGNKQGKTAVESGSKTGKEDKINFIKRNIQVLNL